MEYICVGGAVRMSSQVIATCVHTGVVSRTHKGVISHTMCCLTSLSLSRETLMLMDWLLRRSIHLVVGILFCTSTARRSMQLAGLALDAIDCLHGVALKLLQPQHSRGLGATLTNQMRKI